MHKSIQLLFDLARSTFLVGLSYCIKVHHCQLHHCQLSIKKKKKKSIELEWSGLRAQWVLVLVHGAPLSVLLDLNALGSNPIDIPLASPLRVPATWKKMCRFALSLILSRWQTVGRAATMSGCAGAKGPTRVCSHMSCDVCVCVCVYVYMYIYACMCVWKSCHCHLGGPRASLGSIKPERFAASTERASN